MTETIAGVGIPDSRLAVEATDLVRDTAGPLLFHPRFVPGFSRADFVEIIRGSDWPE